MVILRRERLTVFSCKGKSNPVRQFWPSAWYFYIKNPFLLGLRIIFLGWCIIVWNYLIWIVGIYLGSYISNSVWLQLVLAALRLNVICSIVKYTVCWELTKSESDGSVWIVLKKETAGGHKISYSSVCPEYNLKALC